MPTTTPRRQLRLAKTRHTTPVFAGVDTHKELHVAAVIDASETVLGTHSFSTTRAGYRAMLAWIREFGEPARIGIEGTGSYGAGLTRHLATAGITILEVDRPDRSDRRRTELLGSGSWWCQAAGVEESEGEGWPVLHPLEPVLGDAVQVVDAAGGEIGHAAFEAGPHILDRVEFGRVAGQPVDA